MHEYPFRVLIQTRFTDGFEYLAALGVGFGAIQHDSRIWKHPVHESILVEFLRNHEILVTVLQGLNPGPYSDRQVFSAACRFQ